MHFKSWEDCLDHYWLIGLAILIALGIYLAHGKYVVDHGPKFQGADVRQSWDGGHWDE